MEHQFQFSVTSHRCQDRAFLGLAPGEELLSLSLGGSQCLLGDGGQKEDGSEKLLRTLKGLEVKGASSL